MFALTRAGVGVVLILLMSMALANVLTLEKYKGRTKKEELITIVFSITMIIIVLWYMVLGGV